MKNQNIIQKKIFKECALDNSSCDGKSDLCHQGDGVMGEELVIDCFIGDFDEHEHTIENKILEDNYPSKQNKYCIYFTPSKNQKHTKEIKTDSHIIFNKQIKK